MTTMYADSSATTYIMKQIGKIFRLTPYPSKDSLYIINGESLDITHVGEGKIHIKDGNLKLKNVLIVSKILKKSLISQSTNSR